ncbi:MAG: hypothetical protein P8179_17425 [Candidatus Thiodiazotropha sp.]
MKKRVWENVLWLPSHFACSFGSVVNLLASSNDPQATADALLANNLDTCGVCTIHPRPERRGFSHSPVKSILLNLLHPLFP